MRSVNYRGFTLIELLVVIAIIGLLSTLAVIALNSARQKSRDTKRLSDIRQIATALELFYTDSNVYPTEASPVELGQGGYSAICSNGFQATCTGTAYMGLVPQPPVPADGTCSDTNNQYLYSSPDGQSYSLSFCLGSMVGNLGAGLHTASPSGIE